MITDTFTVDFFSNMIIINNCKYIDINDKVTFYIK